MNGFALRGKKPSTDWTAALHQGISTTTTTVAGPCPPRRSLCSTPRVVPLVEIGERLPSSTFTGACVWARVPEASTQTNSTVLCTDTRDRGRRVEPAGRLGSPERVYMRARGHTHRFEHMRMHASLGTHVTTARCREPQARCEECGVQREKNERERSVELSVEFEESFPS